MTIEALLQGIRGCGCGRDHFCPVDAIEIGAGALAKLPALCRSYRHILMVADRNTYEAAGKRAEALLRSSPAEGCLERVLILENNGDVVIPNEEKIAEIENAMTQDTDLLVGVGSGVINDLCKYTSFFAGIPYFIVATAPSMDGFVSVGAAMILHGMKVTVNARPPKAVIGDVDILKNAPMEMLQAGYGDIIGKFSCLNDWLLAREIRGEYFCQAVYDLTMDCAREVAGLAEGVLRRDERAVSALMEALIKVGVAMSYVDCSRPASGSEHHLSHYFEIRGILEKKPYFAHGIDVAFASVVTARIRDKILAALENGEIPRFLPRDKALWERAIRRIYSASAEGVLAQQKKLGWYEADEIEAKRAESEKANAEENKDQWERVRDILKEAPRESEAAAMVEAVGLSMKDFEVMYGSERIEDGIWYAKDLKDRFTVLWLYYEYFRDPSSC